MKEVVKITKEEHEAHKNVLRQVIVFTFLIWIVIVLLVPDMIPEIILLFAVWVTLMEIFLFGWVFRLRYNLLGPLTKYEEFSEDSDPLKKLED